MWEAEKNVINGINKTLKHLEDDEMVELSLCVLAKLKELTDHEFMKMEFVAESNIKRKAEHGFWWLCSVF